MTKIIAVVIGFILVVVLWYHSFVDRKTRELEKKIIDLDEQRRRRRP